MKLTILLIFLSLKPTETFHITEITAIDDKACYACKFWYGSYYNPHNGYFYDSCSCHQIGDSISRNLFRK